MATSSIGKVRGKQDPKIFSSQNDFSQVVNSDQHEGICFGMTTLWCLNMLRGVRDLLSQPDYRLGETIQQLYNTMTGPLDQSKQAIFTQKGLAGQKLIVNKSVRVALGIIALQPGAWLISNGFHVIGFQTGGAKMYFYDCDENGAGGLFLYDNKTDWEQKVYAAGYPSTENWSGWKMTLA